MNVHFTLKAPVKVPGAPDGESDYLYLPNVTDYGYDEVSDSWGVQLRTDGGLVSWSFPNFNVLAVRTEP